MVVVLPPAASVSLSEKSEEITLVLRRNVINTLVIFLAIDLHRNI